MTTRMTKTMKVMITPHLGRLGSSRYLRHLPPSPRRNPDFHLIHDVGGMKLLVGIPHSLQTRGAVFVTMKQEDRATLLALEHAVPALPNVLEARRTSAPHPGSSTTLGTPDQPC